jgi:hypothetical protein
MQSQLKYSDYFIFAVLMALWKDVFHLMMARSGRNMLWGKKNKVMRVFQWRLQAYF